MMVLRNGDYVPDGQGGFQKAEGAAEVLERVLWKLTVKRGSCPFLPGLGSRLHTLGRARPGEREALAGQYVREALADEDVDVKEVALLQEGDRAGVTARMEWRGETLTATVEVGGLG